MSSATSRPKGATLLAQIVVAVTTLVIIGAVLWAVPIWLWTFALGIVVGVIVERRQARRRRVGSPSPASGDS